MHIAFVASECVPFSKTGGLADVVGALPRALAALGHEVSVYIPRYRLTRISEERTVVQSITVPFDDRYRFCSILTGTGYPGVNFYFVDYPPYFDRDGLYGTSSGDFPDNAERFAMFCRAVLEGSKILGVPDIFHCHDWQASLVPVLLRTQYVEDPAFRNCGIVLTIHNIGYQGLFPAEILPLLTLPWDLFTITKMEFFGNVNFLKGGHRLLGLCHHGKQEVQPGNPDHRVRLRIGRRAQGPSADRYRHPERRGLRRMESRDGQVHRGALFVRRRKRKTGVQA